MQVSLNVPHSTPSFIWCLFFYFKRVLRHFERESHQKVNGFFAWFVWRIKQAKNDDTVLPGSGSGRSAGISSKPLFLKTYYHFFSVKLFWVLGFGFRVSSIRVQMSCHVPLIQAVKVCTGNADGMGPPLERSIHMNREAQMAARVDRQVFHGSSQFNISEVLQICCIHFWTKTKILIISRYCYFMSFISSYKKKIVCCTGIIIEWQAGGEAEGHGQIERNELSIIQRNVLISLLFLNSFSVLMTFHLC